MYKVFGLFFSSLCLMGCTTNIITHTNGNGEASDVVDSTPTIETKVDAEIMPTLKLP